MSDEETGGVWFGFGFWLSWFLPSFWFIVGVMLDSGWDIGIIVWYPFVVPMYLGNGFSCEWIVELFVVP